MFGLPKSVLLKLKPSERASKIEEESISRLPESGLPFVRSPFNYDRDLVSNETGLCCLDESKTHQSFREESDINYIVNTFSRTQLLPVIPISPQYGDFTGARDYHSACNLVLAAQEEFMSLPAEVRSRFNNDPGELVDFLSDSKNRDEAVKLGLVSAKPLDTPRDTDSAVGGAKGKTSKKSAPTPSNEVSEGGEGE